MSRELEADERDRRRKVIMRCYADSDEQRPAYRAARELHVGSATVFRELRMMERDGIKVHRRRNPDGRVSRMRRFEERMRKAVFDGGATVESIREEWVRAEAEMRHEVARDVVR